MHGPIYSDNNELARIIGAGARELVNQAKTLGLTWSVRLATIHAGPTAENNFATAIFDGDTIPLSMINMTGHPLTADDRVYVLIVPPAGNYVVGFTQPMFGLSRGPVDYSSSTASTAPVTVEAQVLTGNSVTWVAGRAYAVTHSSNATGTVANNYALYRLRRGDITGTVLNQNAVQMSSTVGFTVPVFSRTIVCNATSTNIITAVVITLTNFLGGSCTDVGGTTQVRYLEVFDVGPASDYSGAIQI